MKIFLKNEKTTPAIAAKNNETITAFQPKTKPVAAISFTSPPPIALPFEITPIKKNKPEIANKPITFEIINSFVKVLFTSESITIKIPPTNIEIHIESGIIWVLKSIHAVTIRHDAIII